MDNYTAQMYRNSFNDYVEYLGSDVAHFYKTGNDDPQVFGEVDSTNVENSNNMKMAIILESDDSFNNIITSQGISDDVKAIALLPYNSIDSLPYNINEMSKSVGDKLIESDLGFEYKIVDFVFNKISEYIIGIIFILDKV